MNRVKVGQHFQFASAIEAVAMKNPFDGGSMGHQAPACYVTRSYRKSLLGKSLHIPSTVAFTAREAYHSAGGWAVQADSIDGQFIDVRFHQTAGQPNLIKETLDIVLLKRQTACSAQKA